MTAGSSHDAYGLGPFDHIVPIWGVYSNNPLPTTLLETIIYAVFLTHKNLINSW